MILIFAKAPLPGLAKTRLIPALGAEGAAALQAALTRRTLEVAAQSGLEMELWCHPDPGHPLFRDCARRFGIALHAQRGPELGMRMYHAARMGLAGEPAAGPVILIGTDCPTLAAGDLTATMAALAAGDDAVLGPALDGGYYLLGLGRVDRSLFEGIAWGSDRVLAQTRRRLSALGWRWRELTARGDVDRPEDLARLILPPAADSLTFSDGSITGFDSGRKVRELAAKGINLRKVRELAAKGINLRKVRELAAKGINLRKVRELAAKSINPW